MMKKVVKGLFGDVLFALIVATVVGALFVKAYAIPTSSMEGTLLVGDHMFVSKFHYGTRLPQTPLQIPLSHQTVLGIPSYLDWIELPYMRLPALEQIKNNDIVVFNYPKELEHPVDLRTYYVKRCVGIPGDTISIKNKNVFVNGSLLPVKGKQQSGFFIKSESEIRDRVFESYAINEHFRVNGGYFVNTDKATAEQLAKLPFVNTVEELEYEEGEQKDKMFGDNAGNWSNDHYGPLYIPREGDKIILTQKNIEVYGDVILNYDWNEKAEIREGKVFVDNKEITEYTFKQNYYFMVGDNRHNSLDSRYWGFVPEDHVVGKPLFIYGSIDKDSPDNFFSRIKWERMFKWVGNS